MNSEQNSIILEEGEADSENINEILRKYIFHWPLILLGVIFSIGIAFIYLRYSTPVYQINTSLLIKDEGKSTTSADILSQLDLNGSAKVVENEVEILRSKDLMQKVVNRLHLDVTLQAEGRIKSSDIYESKPVEFLPIQMNAFETNDELQITLLDNDHYVFHSPALGLSIKGQYDVVQKNRFGVYRIKRTLNYKNFVGRNFNLSIQNPAQVANQYLSKLTVGVAGKQSTVLNLSFQTTNPALGKDVLRTLIQVYNEASLSDKNLTTQSTIRFIDERLGLISGELTTVERDVENFKTSNGLTDITGEAALYLENVKANDIQLNEVNIQLSAINDIERFVNSNSSKEKIPATFGIQDPVLLGQITQLSELQLQRDQLLMTTQLSNPIVQTVVKQIESTRSAINANIQNITTTLLGAKRQLERNNNNYQGSIKKIPTQERQFISIKRQQSIKESLYLYLLQKREEAALSYASTVADSRVVDEAYSSDAPIKPKRSITYLIALILGVFLPILYLYFKELLNNKVSTLSDITKGSSIPVLGEVMLDEGKEPIVVTDSNRKAIAEQFRAIRTNLQYAHGKIDDHFGRVTLFTSSISGEGKSFVASNVAMSLAISGRKTVLLELDLRKPKISKYLKLINNIGLSNYLIGKASYSDIVQPSFIHDNLFVIGSGPIPPNPSELLIQPAVEDLINQLKDNFDEIIIDSPPIGLVTDAQILARVADASIFIVRHKYTLKVMMEQLHKIYRSKKFPKLNVIFNGVQLSKGYGYGYGYGYYSDESNQERFSLKKIAKNILNRF